jgi:LPXTG-site transpeptidase (sortase) family protein
MKIRRNKKKVSILIAILVLVASVVAGFFIVKYILSDTNENKLFEQQFSEMNVSTTPISEKERDEYTVASELPRYIYIPAAGVDKARMVALGVKSPGKNNQQQLDAPKNIDDVGWYDCRINPVADKRCSQATLPGADITDTATILTGHTCFSRNKHCVFDRVSTLKRGNAITIERGDGKKLEYTVKKVEIVKLEDVDMKKAMLPIESGREGLTLITCAGTYRGITDASGVQTADKRVLVYAVRD